MSIHAMIDSRSGLLEPPQDITQPLGFEPQDATSGLLMRPKSDEPVIEARS